MSRILWLKQCTFQETGEESLLPQSAYETLGLALNNYWDQYRTLLKACTTHSTRSNVHNLRITLRRLIASLDLIEGLVHFKKIRPLRNHFKDHLHLLRDVRDLQVQVASLRGLRKEEVLSEFRAYLLKKRRAEKKIVQKSLKKIKLRKLLTELQEVRERLSFLTYDHLSEQKAENLLGHALKQEFNHLQSIAERVKISDPRTFHATRIQFKKYRYMSEVLESILPLSVAAKKKMKPIQTILGDIQDTVVMIQYLFSFLVDRGDTNPDSKFQRFLLFQAERQKTLMDTFKRYPITS